MKTDVTLTTKKIITILSFMILAISFSSLFAQKTIIKNAKTLTVKGIVSDEKEPLLGVNIILKNTRIGTNTDINGEFTFPKMLKKGDVLLFSYLGYKTQTLVIKDDTAFINLILSEDEIECFGDLADDVQYTSKQSR